MQCISPIALRRSKHVDTVPCGKCNFCLQAKRSDWSFRLGVELKRAVSAFFLTLTYDEANIPASGSLVKKDLQLFMKRARKMQKTYSQFRLRYYAVGEYGTRTSRPHYHAIVFNLHPELLFKMPELWPQGRVHAGDVTDASIHYVTKYVINRMTDYPGRDPPFAIMSRRPGLGASYLDTHRRYHAGDFLRPYVMKNGFKIRMPRYYKDKFFTKVQKERIAEKAIYDSTVAYSESVVRLAKFHDDPYHYYDERVRHEHESIMSKINQLNTF